MTREHTATTTRTLEITTTIAGDEGIEPEYLIEVLAWGLEQHNAAVARLEGSPVLEDCVIDLLAILDVTDEGDKA